MIQRGSAVSLDTSSINLLLMAQLGPLSTVRPSRGRAGPDDCSRFWRAWICPHRWHPLPRSVPRAHPIPAPWEECSCAPDLPPPTSRRANRQSPPRRRDRPSPRSRQKVEHQCRPADAVLSSSLIPRKSCAVLVSVLSREPDQSMLDLASIADRARCAISPTIGQRAQPTSFGLTCPQTIHDPIPRRLARSSGCINSEDAGSDVEHPPRCQLDCQTDRDPGSVTIVCAMRTSSSYSTPSDAAISGSYGMTERTCFATGRMRVRYSGIISDAGLT